MKKYNVCTSPNSDFDFKMIYNEREYIIDKKGVDLDFNFNDVEIELIQLQKKDKFKIQNCILLILGLLLAPIINIVFMDFPKFYDMVSPLSIHGKYLLNIDSTKDKIILKFKDGKFDGKVLTKPKINIKNGSLVPITEFYDINHKDIKHSIFYCIYNISFLVSLGIILMILAFLSIENQAAKIIIGCFLSIFCIISWTTVFMDTQKKKGCLYNSLAQIKNINKFYD